MNKQQTDLAKITVVIAWLLLVIYIYLTLVQRELTIVERVRQITHCTNRPHLEPKISQRGDFLILYNYGQTSKNFKCHENITIATHSDLSRLGYLIPLLKLWKGPISVAVFSPRDDFEAASDSIAFLRNCVEGIKDAVSFHIYFPRNDTPSLFYEKKINCAQQPPFRNFNLEERVKNDIGYPINIGRNIARIASQTHFILSLDPEIYPSPNIIPNFLEFVANNSNIFHQAKPRIFPFYGFEVDPETEIPRSKRGLVKMFRNETARLIYYHSCLECNTPPYQFYWMEKSERKDLEIFGLAKRTGLYQKWTPYFIGTRNDPLFDETLPAEKEARAAQAYLLCVMDYDYFLLNNAFLIYKPDIFTVTPPEVHKLRMSKLRHVAKSELNRVYGHRRGCDF